MKKLIRAVILWAMREDIVRAHRTLNFVDDEVRCAARESECANREANEAKCTAEEALKLAQQLRDN